MGGGPGLRRAFIMALIASDFYVSIEDSEAEQAARGGVSLRAVSIHDRAHDWAHEMPFSSEARLRGFSDVGTRFARVVGDPLFPAPFPFSDVSTQRPSHSALRGQFAVLNRGPSGLVLAPDDIAQMLGDPTPPLAACGAPGHVHGLGCRPAPRRK